MLIDIDLTIRSGERLAIMGRSGAGKSTLVGLLFGQRPSDIALVPQASALVRTLSVFHNVYMGRLDRRSTLHNLRTLVWPRRDDLEEVGSVVEISADGAPLGSGEWESAASTIDLSSTMNLVTSVVRMGDDLKLRWSILRHTTGSIGETMDDRKKTSYHHRDRC